ncbi:hypothetical protein Tco_0995883, partial [Tanacetum coccineum]
YKEAFKMDLEGSPPEATYERCKVWIRQCQDAMASLPPFTSVTLNSQYVDLTKSLPRLLLSAAIVNPTKDEDTVMVEDTSLQAEYLQRRARRDKQVDLSAVSFLLSNNCTSLKMEDNQCQSENLEIQVMTTPTETNGGAKTKTPDRTPAAARPLAVLEGQDEALH